MCVEGVLLKLTRKWLPNPSVLLVTCLGVDWLRSHCLTAHRLCFLEQLVQLSAQPPAPRTCPLSGLWECPRAPLVLRGTGQRRPRLKDEEPAPSCLRLASRPWEAARSRRPRRCALPARVRGPPPVVPPGPRTELHPTCLPYWTLTPKARAGTARCLCAGWRAEPADRLCVNWRASFRLKCLTLCEPFFVLFYFAFKVNKLKQCVYLWTLSCCCVFESGGHVTKVVMDVSLLGKMCGIAVSGHFFATGLLPSNLKCTRV